MELVYLDTSAALKLFKSETETAALETWLAEHGSAIVVTCDLTRTELRRGLHAYDASAALHSEAERWLDASAVVRVTKEIFDVAGAMAPGSRLRSLDALHVAAATALGAALSAFVAYDKRLLEAASTAGLPVESPS